MFNEFIVWDKVLKLFFLKEEIATQSGKVVSLCDGGEWFSVENDSIETFSYIGKTDDTPEQNKIYADSSIFEFEEYISITKTTTKYTGYYRYNEHELRYEIVHGEDEHDIFETRHFEYFHNFKVIGNIQEDKHLLGDNND